MYVQGVLSDSAMRPKKFAAVVLPAMCTHCVWSFVEGALGTAVFVCHLLLLRRRPSQQ